MNKPNRLEKNNFASYLFYYKAVARTVLLDFGKSSFYGS